MYCSRCGAVIPEQAKFCPKCGSAVLRPPVKKKKSHKKAALIIFLIFIIGIGGGFFAFRNNIMAFLSGNKKDEDVYSEAAETLENTLGSSEYQNAELTQRKKIMLDVLEDMENDGVIKKDRTRCLEEDNYIYYQYLNGVEGLITLEDFDDRTVGLPGETLYGENGKKYDISRPDADIAGKYEEENLSALIMLGLGQPDFENNIYKLSKSWTSDGLRTDVDNDVTVKEMAEKLKGYDFIYILLHGNYQPNISDTQLIFIKEKRTLQKDKDYAADLKKHNLLHNPTKNGTYYVIAGDFFNDHYSEKKELDNSIVFIGCCRGYYQNDNLVRQFAESGAKAVIGATETVWTDYEIRTINEFVCGLLCGNTVSEALDQARTAVGKDELDYYEKLYDKYDITSGYSIIDHNIAKTENPQFKLYKNGDNDGTAVLVTLKGGSNPPDKPAPDADPVDSPEIIQAVLDSEDLWLDKLNFEGGDGFNECWFQDINMDGEAEFIAGGNSKGAHAAKYFYLYHLKDGRLEPLEDAYGSNELVLWNRDYNGGHNGFSLKLYKSKASGNFTYIYENIDGTAMYTDFTLTELTNSETYSGKSVLSSNNILHITETGDRKGNLTYLFTGTGNGGKEISKEEAMKLYNDFFGDLTAYKTTTYAVPCSKLSADIKNHSFYDTMSKEGKKQLLLESYNAWSYTENAGEEPLMADIIERIKVS